MIQDEWNQMTITTTPSHHMNKLIITTIAVSLLAVSGCINISRKGVAPQSSGSTTTTSTSSQRFSANPGTTTSTVTKRSTSYY
jgi:hypothetical protein